MNISVLSYSCIMYTPDQRDALTVSQLTQGLGFYTKHCCLFILN